MKPHLDPRIALQRASRRYHRLFRPGSSWLWGYAWSKYRLDPAYLQVAALIPARSLTVDLGSGLALLPALLAELGEGRESLALEWDGTKVAAARSALKGVPAIRIEQADVFETAFPSCDAVVAMDILHYFPEGRQDALLKRAAAALRPGGRLILRETESRRGSGSAFTRRLEWLAIHCGWNRGPELHFRSRAQWQSSLEALGLHPVQLLESSLVTPGNVLIHGIKPAEQP